MRVIRTCVKMFLLIPTLLVIFAGQCYSQQMMTCSYTSEQKNLQRVWCKRDTDDHSCCTGFHFNSLDKQLEDRSLSVQDDGKAFVVSVKSLSQGEGVYWCGVMNGTNVIVKLAESYLYSRTETVKNRAAPSSFIWDILRWIVFALLLAAVFSANIYSNKKARKEKKNDVYETVLEEKQR